MPAELLPWAARKTWHRRWHRPVSRDGACVLVTACEIRLDCHQTKVRNGPGRLRMRFCGRCINRLAAAPMRRRRAVVADGQLGAWS